MLGTLLLSTLPLQDLQACTTILAHTNTDTPPTPPTPPVQPLPRNPSHEMRGYNSFLCCWTVCCLKGRNMLLSFLTVLLGCVLIPFCFCLMRMLRRVPNRQMPYSQKILPFHPLPSHIIKPLPHWFLYTVPYTTDVASPFQSSPGIHDPQGLSLCTSLVLYLKKHMKLT